jgi:hypothetical protein
MCEPELEFFSVDAPSAAHGGLQDIEVAAVVAALALAEGDQRVHLGMEDGSGTGTARVVVESTANLRKKAHELLRHAADLWQAMLVSSQRRDSRARRTAAVAG